MKRRMDNSGQNDSISISALILSPFAITGKEGIFIWFGNSKDSVSMLLRKKGHRPEDVVSCIIPMSNDKHLFHLAQWQKLAKNHCWCLGNRLLCEFLGSPQNTLLSKNLKEYCTENSFWSYFDGKSYVLFGHSSGEGFFLLQGTAFVHLLQKF